MVIQIFGQYLKTKKNSSFLLFTAFSNYRNTPEVGIIININIISIIVEYDMILFGNKGDKC